MGRPAMGKAMMGAFNTYLVCLLAGWLAFESAWACQPEHLYSTGRMMEIDRCASAWLIKRYIDQDARFAFYEDGDIIDCGTAFDTPDARFCRTHNQATFEVLMDYFDLQDPRLEILGRAIHELEIDYWGSSRQGRLARKLALEVNAIIKSNPDPEECIEQCLHYFDRLMGQLPVGGTQKGKLER